jgi:hypothetical protein
MMAEVVGPPELAAAERVDILVVALDVRVSLVA